MKLELTDSVIRSLKPESKKYTVWDTTADPTGLGVRIRPTGVKTYVVRARPRPTDRQIMVTLGRAGTLKVSPAASLRDKSVGLTGAMMRRQRVLTEDEIKSVWHAASDAGMFGVLVKILLATAQRRDDWAEAKWSELSGLDGDYPLLTVPAARYKVGQTHEVPLTPLAVDLLRSLPRFAGSDWIFTVNGPNSISSFTRPKSKLDKASGVTGWTLHDLRRTGRTLMANLEVADETAERVLGHSLGGLMATYNVSRHRKQKMAALVALETDLLRIIRDAGGAEGNVIPLRLAS